MKQRIPITARRRTRKRRLVMVPVGAMVVYVDRGMRITFGRGHKAIILIAGVS